jgi:nitrate reductase molybdenum cofactor assembly chaperone NarJ/NarW
MTLTVTPTKSFLVVGLLLGYPDEEVFAASEELLLVLEREARVGANCLADLRKLFPASKATPEERAHALLDAQERYSQTFDGGRRGSLHLFEHVHGDGKQRGQALVELTERYTALGVALRQGELPDYLPALCELASMGGDGLALLVETKPVLEILAQNLVERASPYASVVRALLDLLTPGVPLERGAAADTAATTAALTESDDGVPSRPTTLVPPPIDLEELDREWAESPVEFGVGAAHDALVPLRRSRDAEAALVPRA